MRRGVFGKASPSWAPAALTAAAEWYQYQTWLSEKSAASPLHDTLRLWP